MIRYIKKKLTKQATYQEDLYAVTLHLSQLSKDLLSYVPWNQYSLHPFSLAIVLNDILLNKRKSMIEFGSGLSTIYICQLIRKNKLECQFTSVDHHADWLDQLEVSLRKEGLQDFVTLIHSPLNEYDSPLKREKIQWYDQGTLKDKLKDKTYDCILVDGPPWKGSHQRYFALPFLKKNGMTEPNSMVFLDDANRKSEREILERWTKDYGLAFEIVNNRFAYCTNASAFKLKLLN